MKLLSMISTVNPAAGGPIEGILRFNENARRLGVHQEIVSLDHPDDPWLVDYPVPVHPVGRRRGGGGLWRRLTDHYFYSPAYVPWLRANLRNYDVGLVHGLWNYGAFGASRVLPEANTPYFMFSHGMLDPWFRRRYPLKHVAKQLFWLVGEGRMAARAESVLFTCEEERLLARNVFHGHRYRETVVGYGAAAPPPLRGDEAAVLAEAIPELGDGPFLLFLSRIHEKKGCDLLIEGFARQKIDMPSLKLVIAGPDNDNLTPRLRAMAAARGLADRILFPGPQYGNAKWAALRRAEAFILPSHQENFGIAVAEALGCGTPVLISDKVNIWREIASAGAGMVAPDTIDGAASLVGGWLAMSRDEQRRMGAAAARVFDAEFDVRNTTPRLVEAIRARLVGRAGTLNS